jgi:hypothetical protein
MFKEPISKTKPVVKAPVPLAPIPEELELTDIVVPEVPIINEPDSVAVLPTVPEETEQPIAMLEEAVQPVVVVPKVTAKPKDVPNAKKGKVTIVPETLEIKGPMTRSRTKNAPK